MDKKFSKTQGVSVLKSLTSSRANGIARLQWKGEDYRVIFDEVRSDYPSMNWKLGFMVPDSVISKPINNLVLSSGVILIVMLFVIAVTEVLDVTETVSRITEHN